MPSWSYGKDLEQDPNSAQGKAWVKLFSPEGWNGWAGCWCSVRAAAQQILSLLEDRILWYKFVQLGSLCLFSNLKFIITLPLRHVVCVCSLHTFCCSKTPSPVKGWPRSWKLDCEPYHPYLHKPRIRGSCLKYSDFTLGWPSRTNRLNYLPGSGLVPGKVLRVYLGKALSELNGSFAWAEIPVESPGCSDLYCFQTMLQKSGGWYSYHILIHVLNCYIYILNM